MKKFYLLLSGLFFGYLIQAQTPNGLKGADVNISTVTTYSDLHSLVEANGQKEIKLTSGLKSASSAVEIVDPELMECSDNSAFSNPPVLFDNGYTSDLKTPYKVYQTFDNLSGITNEVAFWVAFSTYTQPSPTFEFIIEVFEAGPLPVSRLSSDTVEVSLEYTGFAVVGHDIFKCNASITPIANADGWISIYGSLKNSASSYWINAPSGQGQSYQEGYGYREPVAVCLGAGILPLEVTLFPNGKYALTQEDKEILSGDPEKYQSIEVSPRSFDCNSVGESVPVTISVVDTSGVPSTFSGYVLVYDETAPEAKCKDITVTLDDSGEASIFGGQIDDGSYDACGIKNRVLDKYNFYCADLGKDTITLTVGDASGNLSSCTSEVTVLSVNKMPALNPIADVTVDEDSAVTVDLTGISYGDDCEAQDLVVSVTVSDSAMIDTMGVDYTSGDPEGTLNISPAADMSGSTVVTVTVEDEEGASVSQNFTLTINPVNDAPFLVIPIPDQTIYASYELNIPVSSVLGVIFDDVDDDELEMSVMVEGTDTLPSWATMSADILVCEPMIADTGCVNIVVMATDSSGASASDTFEVCVAGYPTAIGDLEVAGPEIQMYPNPTNGQVNLEMSSGIHAVDIAVVDIAGRVVLQKQYSASERIVFDMSGKVAGMYFVNMKIDGERVVKKLIVDNR
ncbi:T9SS type A sorting domain-containing protein [Maribellus comscasis]|uniref:T9SS type A sorting domain-containing protein n=1 Tax=Maribellus comscasis TaxID=2681766 RepID=A0A6I6K5G1_9BACT|nr:T9SS type A sorting domain-containing protein [Maribellus comscasis]QGY45234.1 T9SS type A sorting domain-containing protein [Maribellus comscasis]